MKNNGKPVRVDSFDLVPGRRLARKYTVGEMLGHGWEGEVYHVTEIATGIERAAKVFYPQRNIGNQAIKVYATKLNRLRACSIIIQYHNQDVFRYKRVEVPFLLSEYVRGEILSEFLKSQRGKRLQVFEALHLLKAVAQGIAEIHALGEYHGDLHSDNIIIRRKGLGFEVKVVDMYHWGKGTKSHRDDDLCALIRLFYDSLGGQRWYRSYGPEVREICCGLKRSLITKRFKSVGDLCRHLDHFSWE